jgi:hypothetical protein
MNNFLDSKFTQAKYHCIDDIKIRRQKNDSELSFDI